MDEVRQQNLAGMHAYKGTGPVFVKLGKHRRYRVEDIEAWISANRQGGDHDAEC